MDVITFGALEKEPHPRVEINPYQLYRIEEGACLRNDTKVPVEGLDFHFTSGANSTYCKNKCN